MSFRLSVSRIKPRFGPGLIRRLAAEFNAIVQSKGPIVPEFETYWCDPPPAPPRRPRHLADEVIGGDLGNRLLERESAFQRLRLLAGPGADLGLLRPGGEIGVGLGVAHGRHIAADPDLPAHRLPGKQSEEQT